MSAAVYARLRVADPARWRAIARAWGRWATLAGRLADRLAADLVRLGAAWSGAAASTAAARLTTLRRGLTVVRLLCWRADQTASELRPPSTGRNDCSPAPWPPHTGPA